jgi:two-component system chemotaxis response regulator CheB
MTPPAIPGSLFAGAAFDVVVLAASAGGLRAVTAIVQALPSTFPAGLVVVQHQDPRHRSLLADILGRRTALQVRQAVGGDRLEPGVFFTAVPGRHLLIKPDLTLAMAESEPIHFLRPSADLLFESAAAACHSRALAVVLSGTGMDGSNGVIAIKAQGGTTIAQDPASAELSGMPEAAIRTGRIDLILALEEIGPALLRLVTQVGQR